MGVPVLPVVELALLWYDESAMWEYGVGSKKQGGVLTSHFLLPTPYSRRKGGAPIERSETGISASSLTRIRFYSPKEAFK
jgi:hypothetical protein